MLQPLRSFTKIFALFSSFCFLFHDAMLYYYVASPTLNEKISLLVLCINWEQDIYFESLSISVTHSFEKSKFKLQFAHLFVTLFIFL